MTRFKDVDIPRQVRRRYRRAPHGIELEGGVRLAAARTHDWEGEACRLVGTLDESYSVSVPVSSAACCFDPLIGFPDD